MRAYPVYMLRKRARFPWAQARAGLVSLGLLGILGLGLVSLDYIHGLTFEIIESGPGLDLGYGQGLIMQGLVSLGLVSLGFLGLRAWGLGFLGLVFSGLGLVSLGILRAGLVSLFMARAGLFFPWAFPVIYTRAGLVSLGLFSIFLVSNFMLILRAQAQKAGN
jgi:hypothetical protein